MVMYSDSETLSRVTAVRSRYTKGSFYTSVRIPPVTDNVFSTTGVEQHKALRANIAGGVRSPPIPPTAFPCLSNISCPTYNDERGIMKEVSNTSTKVLGP